MSLDLYIGNKNYSSWSLRPWLLLKHLKEPLIESHMAAHSVLRDGMQGARGSEWSIPFATSATQQTARKISARGGCAKIARSRRCAPRHRSPSYDLRRTPCDHRDFVSNAAYGGLDQRFLTIPFTEHMVSVAGRDYNPALRPISANSRVPCLHVDGFQIWESLAIAEYLAEQNPQLWPVDAKARARARSISAEMHAGFANLRKAMPFNLKLKLKGKVADAAVQRDIDRIVEIWTEARTRFATPNGKLAGPYLFGAFSIADGMYAPIACRFHTYNVSLPPVAAEYRDTLLAHPTMLEWYDAALKETEAHAHTDELEKEYGGPR
jgi:glutathione S-transferase